MKTMAGRSLILPFVHYSVQRNLYEIGRAFAGFFSNFPNGFVGRFTKKRWCSHLVLVTRCRTTKCRCKFLMRYSKPSVIRDRLTHLCYLGTDKHDPTGSMEQAFLAVHQAQPLMKKIYAAQKEGKIARKLPVAGPNHR